MNLRLFILFILPPSYLNAQSPVAVNDTINTYQTTDLIIKAKSNDFDPDGGPLSIDTLLYSGNGSVENFGGFEIRYTSPNSFTGTDLITYVVCDDDIPQMCDTGLVLINVFDSTDVKNDVIDINNVKALVNADGTLFLDQNTSTSIYEVPKGSGQQTIFLSKLWISGDDQFGQRYGAYGFYYTGADFWPGPIMNLTAYTFEERMKWNRVWNVTQMDIDFHIANFNQPGYIPIPDILEWPAHGDPSLGQAFYLAPFKDANANGVYDPENGDYPRIKGDQAAYFMYNDAKYNHGSGGNKLDIEIHGMLYSFDCPTDSALHNTVFLNYRVINRSTRIFYDCYMGQLTDPDIGNFTDDLLECDVQRSSFFAFNEDSSSAQAMTILAGALMDSDLTDGIPGQCDESINGYGFGDSIVDNERYGMSRFITYCTGSCNGAVQGVPSTSDQVYQLLRGKWFDDSRMRHGGYGHINNCSSCEYSRFMFPGSSDPCGWGVCDDEPLTNCGNIPADPLPWNTENAGTFPNDVRGIGSFGPFTMEPDEEIVIDLAFTYGNDYDNTDNKNRSVDIMKERIDSIRSYFINNESPCGGILLSHEYYSEDSEPPTLTLYPNPTNELIYVKLDELVEGKSYAIYDLTGRRVQEGTIDSGGSVHVGELSAGIFVIQVKYRNTILRTKFAKL